MLKLLTKTLQTLNWSIRYKVGLAFGVVIFCFIMNGFFSVVLLFHLKASQEEQKANTVYLQELQLFELAFNSQSDLYSDAIFTIKSDYIRDNFKTIITNAITKGNRKETNQANRTFLTDFGTLYSKTLEHFYEFENLIEQKQFNQAGIKWNEYAPDFDQIKNLFKQRHYRLEIENTNITTEVNNAVSLAVSVLVGLTIISILLGILALILIEHALVSPLNELQQALIGVSHGELGQDIKIANRDEIGDLESSFSSAVRALQQVLRGVQVGEYLATVTSQLSIVSKEQASGSGQQVNVLSSMLITMQELVHTASMIARNTSQIANLINTTRHQIELVAQASCNSQLTSIAMIQVVEATMQGVERVEEQVEIANFRVHEMAEHSEMINRVVILLETIANEVRLLALNAAIEASTAGTFGTRFKEIAREIKGLAKRSHRFMAEARTLVNAVQSSSQEVLSQMTYSQAEVKAVIEGNTGMRHNLTELEQSTNQVGQAVAQLQGLAELVNNQAQEIKQATAQQLLSSEQVIFSAHTIEDVARQTAIASQQTADSCGQLEKLTVQLNHILSQVKLT